MRDYADVEYVWIIEDNIMAQIVSLGPYHAIVKYVENGIEYEIMLQREEFMFMDNTKYDNITGVDFCGFGPAD